MNKAVLFDFDGVLAETMEDNFLAWAAAMAEYGYDFKREEYFLLEGMSVINIAAKFCRQAGLDEQLAGKIAVRKDEYYKENNRFKFYPGVENLISILFKSQVPLGIVTASTRARFISSVSPGFLANFSSLVTGENGGRGKPFPDPYLRGAADLGLDPTECVVVENAPLGIKSAKEAGAYVIAITSTLSATELWQADEIVENFFELSGLKTIINLQGK